jgi:hypothetical protein
MSRSIEQNTHEFNSLKVEWSGQLQNLGLIENTPLKDDLSTIIRFTDEISGLERDEKRVIWYISLFFTGRRVRHVQ